MELFYGLFRAASEMAKEAGLKPGLVIGRRLGSCGNLVEEFAFIRGRGRHISLHGKPCRLA